MKCIICGTALSQWPGGGGYGNNPDPWPSPQAARVLAEKANDDYRCCETCNSTVVIPMRLAMLGV